MKTNIVLPIAGNGQRFVDEGFKTIKPLIEVEGEYLVEKSLGSVNYKDANLIFIVRNEHVRDFDLSTKLRSRFGNMIEIIEVEKITEGALCTCLMAEKYIDNEAPLVIFTPDCYFEPRFYVDHVDPKYDGVVTVFQSQSPAHSYVQLDENNYVTKAAEKEVISNHAVGGLYYFKHGSTFVKYAKKQIELNMKTKGEYYICPVYNLLIEDELKIGIDKNSRHVILGTPQDLRDYLYARLPA
jgi:dTDP-glucose pyrophosphorylase